jgi:hypothetical protein
MTVALPACRMLPTWIANFAFRQTGDAATGCPAAPRHGTNILVTPANYSWLAIEAACDCWRFQLRTISLDQAFLITSDTPPFRSLR